VSNKLIRSFIILTTLWLAGCTVEVRAESTATVAPIIITATLPPTLIPRPSETPLPPPPQPTIAPVQGTTNTQLNVRAEPSTTSEVLGIIPAQASVQIVGKDPGENWWQIIYEAGVDGKGWVTAQYVETATRPDVPTIGGAGADPNAGNSAIIIQQLNIRSGPATNFNSLGVLNANDVVTLTGKNQNGTWLQIEFTDGPEGKGWVNSGFVKADNVDALPIISDLGEVVGTGTPMDTPPPPTPTLVPAALDFDSAETPIKTVLLEGVIAQTVLYNGDVSAPDGDTDDWIAVTTYGNTVFMSIQCQGSNNLQIDITETATQLICNDILKAVPVKENTELLIHIRAVSPQAGILQYTNYTLTIKASP